LTRLASVAADPSAGPAKIHTRMRIIVIRHGHRNGQCLSLLGEHQVHELALALEHRGVKATLYLSSDARYAKQTRNHLAAALSPTSEAITQESPPLNARPGLPGGMAHIVSASQSQGIDLRDHDTIVLVGHEGRLSNLLTELTSQRSRPLERGGAVGVRADDFRELLKGRADVDFRYPVVDHQEAALRQKVQSKMTVATFLAGFVSAALVALILTDDFGSWRQVAAVLLTLALGLFVATVYIYDELSMPEGFWLTGRPSQIRRRLTAHHEHQRVLRWESIAQGTESARASVDDVTWLRDPKERRKALADEDAAEERLAGPIYTYMVQTWTFVFTPAIAFSLLGFGVIMFDGGTRLAGLASLTAVVVAVGWLMLRRAPTATD
jgi:phosphohistidine phosphatase SixA